MLVFFFANPNFCIKQTFFFSIKISTIVCFQYAAGKKISTLSITYKAIKKIPRYLLFLFYCCVYKWNVLYIFKFYAMAFKNPVFIIYNSTGFAFNFLIIYLHTNKLNHRPFLCQFDLSKAESRLSDRPKEFVLLPLILYSFTIRIKYCHHYPLTCMASKLSLRPTTDVNGIWSDNSFYSFSQSFRIEGNPMLLLKNHSGSNCYEWDNNKDRNGIYQGARIK